VAGAVVLLSGGVDSAVCLFKAVGDSGPGEVVALTFDWGQRSLDEEAESSRSLCEAAGVRPPLIVRIQFPYGGLLTEEGVEIPGDRTALEITGGGVAPTFFPARNLVMLAHAFGLAASEGVHSIYFGASASDESGYPDCRPAFVSAMETAGNLALGGHRVSIATPLIGMSKAAVIALGEELGVPWRLTFSCYTPVGGRPCGRCDSCVLRRAAFAEAKIPDPYFNG
jgi:7-cyano-7-deazaguanine synthase